MLPANFKRAGLKPAFALPVIGMFLLALFVMTPTIAYQAEWSTFNNWYLFTEFTGWKNIFSFVTVSVFIYLSADVLLVETLLRKIPETLGGDSKSDDSLASEKVKGYQSRQTLIAFILFIIFVLQVLWLNTKAVGEGNLRSSIIALTLSCVGFYFLTKVKILLEAAVDIAQTRSTKAYASSKATAWLRYVGTKLGTLILAARDSAIQLTPSFSQTKDAIEKKYDSTWKLLLEREDKQTNPYRELYVLCATSVWIYVFLCAALAILLLNFTNPSGSFHSGFPVFFYITLLLTVGILLVKLLRNFQIVRGLIYDLYELICLILQAMFELLMLHKKAALIVFILAISAWSLVEFQQSRIKHSMVEVDSFTRGNPTSSDNEDNVATQEAASSKDCSSGATTQRPLVLVAAAGGGIAAAAWTATTLEALNSIDNRKCPERSLAKNITAISGVSGGTLGAYYYLAKEQLIQICIASVSKSTGQHIDDRCRDQIANFIQEKHISPTDLASRSSLGSVAWGFSVYEILHYIKLKSYGRERALENRWQSSYCNSDDEEALDIAEGIKFNACLAYERILRDSMDAWSARSHSVPDFLINATIQEKGKRVVFSTNEKFSSEESVTSRESSDSNSLSTSDAELRTYKCASRLPVVRATRYSATFPYVTPATRLNPAIDCDVGSMARVHLMDGGYVDNSGIQSLLDYMKFHDQQNDNELSRVENRRKVIVIKIDAYQHDDYIPKDRSPLIHELLSPITGIMNTRKAQGHSNRLDVDRLERQGYSVEPVVYLRYPGKQLPLSWHLSRSEAQSVKEVYNAGNIALPSSIDSERCANLQESDPINIHLACLQTFWERQVEIKPTPEPGVNHESLKELLGDIPQRTKGLLLADSTTPYAIFLAKWKELSRALKLISLLSTTNSQNGQIITLLKQIAKNILQSNGLPTDRSNEPLWMERARSLVCSDSEEPMLVATSPSFKKGLPAVNDSLLTINELGNCGPKNCSDEELYDEKFRDANKENMSIEQQTFVVGMASAKDKPKNNFNLAERRAIWLLKRINKAQRFKKIRPISWGEMIPLEHPRLEVFGVEPGSEQAHQYAFAFQCIQSS